MRVEKAEGTKNMLLIAPHGWQEDDTNTDVLVRTMAAELNAYYVINFGWKRNETLNIDVGFANCNDIRHCQNPAVSDFYDPVVEYSDALVKKYGAAQILFIHGMGDHIRQQVADIDVVLGYGEGDPARYTCDIWRKNLLADMLMDRGLVTRDGISGGRFSAHNKHNLTQAICGNKKHGIQVEIVCERRKNIKKAIETGILFADAVKASKKYVFDTVNTKQVTLSSYQCRHTIEKI